MSGGRYTPWGFGKMKKANEEKAKAPEIEPPPQATDVSVQEAARAETESLRKKKGWRASLVTGGQGVTTEPTTEKALLGQ